MRARSFKAESFLIHQRREGVVLIVVLVLVVLVALAGFGFVATMSTEYAASRIHEDQIQAEYTADSAELYILAMLDELQRTEATQVNLADNPDVFRGVPLISNSISEARQMESPVESRGQWKWTAVNPSLQSPDTTSWSVRFGLQDESAKLSLQGLLEWELTDPDAGRRALMRLPGMTVDVADAILDWIDPDDEPREQGAESEYYQRLDTPYSARNAIPQTLEELLFVRGVSRELLLGLDRDRNFVLDPGEATSAQSNSTLSTTNDVLPPQGWSQFLTVDAVVRDVTRRGTEKIDLNSPDLMTLHQQLAEQFSSELAHFVIWWRQFGPSPAIAAGSVNPSASIDFARPSQFPIASATALFGACVEVQDGDERRVVKSPLGLSRDALRQFLPALLDLTTTQDAELLYGRVNINEAPLPVLLGMPGMTEGIADQIINTRVALSDELRESAAWPVIEGLISPDEAVEFLDWATVRGHRYRTQVIAFRDEIGPIRRVELVIDASNTPARALHRIDLTPHGIGFPRSFLRSFANPTETDFASPIGN